MQGNESFSSSGKNCGRPRRNTRHNLDNNQSPGLHGLAGLEIIRLRKTFNSESKYNFDRYLSNSIPEQYSIAVINEELNAENLNEDGKNSFSPSQIRSFENDEFLNIENSKYSFDELRNSLKDKFAIDLVDHERIKGPPSSSYGVGVDPLDDKRYLKTNDKLAKRERKFILSDRDKILNEVENCIEILSILGIEVKRSALNDALRNYVVENVELSEEQIFRLSQLLGTITSINDLTDSVEMVLKYRLTVREIRSFLLNYTKIKTLEGFLKREILQYHLSHIDNSNEVYTESNINFLNKKRLHDRNGRIGKIIEVKFKDGVKLLIDPISKPAVSASKNYT